MLNFYKQFTQLIWLDLGLGGDSIMDGYRQYNITNTDFKGLG